MFRTFIAFALVALTQSAHAGVSCLAQDNAFSYEGAGAKKAAASQNALAACRAQSDSPELCYLHRCWSEGREESRGSSRVAPLTYEEMRAINEALNEQHCIATGNCCGRRH